MVNSIRLVWQYSRCRYFGYCATKGTLGATVCDRVRVTVRPRDCAVDLLMDEKREDPI